MTSLPLWLALPLTVAASSPTNPGRGAAAHEPLRVAVVVGAGAAAPGRPALRFAHRDADSVGDVLASVGRFPRGSVHVLHDPAPEALLALLRRETSALAGQRDAMLFFYFSGHADGASLFSAGRRVPLDDVRRVLDAADVGVRIGVIDACQGGGWTRAKGLVPEAPFEVPIPQLLESEGSALLASSTGDESAHESDALAGSFFTVHLTAGLRGAADESGDGQVTLTEAFEYARTETIRDTALHAREPQHPSYALNLRGRQDVVLAQVSASPSTLALEQEGGPLELVHLASGLRLVELPPGARNVTLAVPPGRYLVRRVGAEGVRVREITVPREGSTRVREAELALVATERLAVKGGFEHERAAAIPRDGEWELAFGGFASNAGSEFRGWQTGSWLESTRGYALRFDGRMGLGRHVTWKVGTLAFAWRFGNPQGWEIVPWAGAPAWAFDDGVLFARAGSGFGLRRTSGRHRLVLTGSAEVDRGAVWGIRDVAVGHAAVLRYRGALGYGIRIGGRVDVHLAAGVVATQRSREDQVALAVGSVQELGLATLPLVRVQVHPGTYLDLHVSKVFERTRDVAGGSSVLVGGTALF